MLIRYGGVALQFYRNVLRDVKWTNFIHSSSKFCFQASRKYGLSFRKYSTEIRSATSSTNSNTMPNKSSDSCELNEELNIIIEVLTKSEDYKDIPWVTRWYEKMLLYNLQGGKKFRSSILIEAYRAFSPSKLTPEFNKLANLMGWCVEMLQVFYLVHDDLLDDAETRRNQPCWFRINENGLNAINDGVLIENGIYQILKKYFRSQPYYTNVMELFHDTIFKTTMGQILDSRASKTFRITRNLEEFTPDFYRAIVKYKTAYYTFQLPVSAALYMAGIADEERHKQVSEILLDIGNYFQIQDDFLDCFGDPTIIGKSGTDIQEGKCTWLLVTALQKVNFDQKLKLKEFYGTSNSENIAAVKKIYKEVGLKEIYTKHQEELYDNLTLRIQKLSNDISSEVLLKILKKLYKRSL